MAKRFVYLDYAATAPMDPRVFEKMKPYFCEEYGNPSSIYEFGQNARRAIDTARGITAGALGCSLKEMIFTGGGSEANSLAIFGALSGRSGHIITSKIEHHSVLLPFQQLEKKGFTVTYVDVNPYGAVDLEQLKKSLQDDTILVSIMYANNEIGTVQPIQKIRGILGNRNGPLFHTDACQALGYLPMKVDELGVDLLTMNAGKAGGPKGVGALYIRKGIRIAPQILGGGQEFQMRGGTENVPGIVGFGEAVRLAQELHDGESARIRKLRDRLAKGILEKIPNTRINGHPIERLPNSLHCTFDNIQGEAILVRLDMEGICASTGSACTSGTTDPSHVLLALGMSYGQAQSSVRFTLGRFTEEEDIAYVLEKLPAIVYELRKTHRPLARQKTPPKAGQARIQTGLKAIDPVL